MIRTKLHSNEVLTLGAKYFPRGFLPRTSAKLEAYGETRFYGCNGLFNSGFSIED
jgi:hypothetical protein